MREQILSGKLEYPGFLTLIKYINQEDDILAFWNSIWHTYLNSTEVNGLYWYDRLGPKCFNEIVRALDYHGWVLSHGHTGRRWASVELNEDKLLEWVSKDELQEVKKYHKYDRYKPTARSSNTANLTKQNGVLRNTGLVRKGFSKSGNTRFSYDMDMLSKYTPAVRKNLTKSMDKVRKFYPDMKSDSTTYDNVSIDLFDWHINNPDEVFTTGTNTNDSRGRAISACLGKVTNPIGNKDFRSCLKITYEED